MNPKSLPPPILITTPQELALLVAELREAGRFALDTESNSLYAYHYRVCLVQISTDTSDFLIDTLVLDELEPLRELVAESDIEVTMHAAENDILLMHRFFGFTFRRVFDTLWGARILGWSRPGLASLLKKLYGVELNKKMQRTNWGKRPLTPEQIDYARLDTHYLLRLRDYQEEALRRKNRWEEAREVFAELTQIRWEEKPSPSVWRLPGVRDLDPRQLAVAHALFAWRESTASRRDVPPFKILRNETIITLAQEQPASEEELRRLPGISRRLPGHVARKILQVIRQGQKAPPPVYPQRRDNGSRPDEQETARYEALRAWRTRVAEERGVDPDVVLTNHVLMALARTGATTLEDLRATGLLGGWKLKTYGQDILRIITATTGAEAGADT
ncbi:MAG: ribonuclease D [Caldilineae bacterium]|nr:MAG: ribonuclease D [Caldilineae bacterium]